MGEVAVAKTTSDTRSRRHRASSSLRPRSGCRRVEPSGERRGIVSAGDAGNLRRGEGDDAYSRIIAVDDIEVVEVAACGAEDEDAPGSQEASGAVIGDLPPRLSRYAGCSSAEKASLSSVRRALVRYDRAAAVEAAGFEHEAIRASQAAEHHGIVRVGRQAPVLRVLAEPEPVLRLREHGREALPLAFRPRLWRSSRGRIRGGPGLSRCGRRPVAGGLCGELVRVVELPRISPQPTARSKANAKAASRVVRMRISSAGRVAADEVPPSRLPATAGVWQAPRMTDALRTLYPEIEPYRSERLRVDEIHEIHLEESGNPGGKPVLFVHGGPAAARSRSSAAISIQDTIGSSSSISGAAAGARRTRASSEILRGISWPTWRPSARTLASSAGCSSEAPGAARSPSPMRSASERVTALVLRGIFLLDAVRSTGSTRRVASRIFPDAWEPYLAEIPAGERADLLAAYHRRLTSDDPATRLRAARAWSIWEAARAGSFPTRADRTHG